jgi:hemolysin activation/secretion protein
MTRLFRRSALLLASLLSTAVAAHTSTPAPAPGDIGQALPRRDQIEQQPPREPVSGSRVRVDAGGAIAQAPCALDSSPVRVVLSSISLQDPEGAPVAPEIQRLLAPIGIGPAGEQPISVVCRIRDEANALLNQAGFVALAQIPAQEISSGAFKVTIVSARIVEVRVLGDLGPYKSIIESRLEALRQLQPLNRRDAERILLLTGDVPGVDVRLALRPAGPEAKPGEVIGELSVEINRVQLLANFQNYGSRQLGREIASLRLEAYGLTGLADRTFFAFSNSIDWDEIHVLQAGHDFELGTSGIRAGVRGSLALSRPDILRLDLRSRSTIATFELSHLLARSVSSLARGAAGLELLDQTTKIHQDVGSVPFTRDKLRVAFARLEGDFNFLTSGGSPLASLAGYLEARKGIDILDASQRGASTGGAAPSRFEGDPQAWVLRGEVTTELRPHPNIAVGAIAFGQWANNRLLNLEEFSLGNFTFGRGYDPGANGGDRAYAVRIEPRLRLPLALPVSVELTRLLRSGRHLQSRFKHHGEGSAAPLRRRGRTSDAATAGGCRRRLCPSPGPLHFERHR